MWAHSLPEVLRHPHFLNPSRLSLRSLFFSFYFIGTHTLNTSLLLGSSASANVVKGCSGRRGFYRVQSVTFFSGNPWTSLRGWCTLDIVDSTFRYL